MQIINGAGKVSHEWDPHKIYDVIDFIRARPAFSLGNEPKTINNLYLYLGAYQNALAGTRLLNYGIPDFSHFSTWCCGWRKKGALAAGWDYHILHKARRNKYKAYDLFFETLDNFKHAVILAQEAVLTEAQRESAKNSGIKRYRGAHFSDTGDHNLIPAPHRILVFRIGEVDSRWTAFLDQDDMPIYDAFTDKKHEPFREAGKEFGLRSHHWKPLSAEESLRQYKRIYKDNGYPLGMTIKSSSF